MQFELTVSERRLLWLSLGLLLLAVCGPNVAQPESFHHFADQRGGFGVPHLMDVLTNLPFALWGAWGLVCLWRLPKGALDAAQLRLAGLFFVGLLLTCVGSSWYHWMPDDAGLALDRMGMAVAFAGLLGLVGASRISARAGRVLAALLLLAAPLSLGVFVLNANVFPWAVLQFGGMLLALWMATQGAGPTALSVRWGWVIAIYAAAKLLELGDHQVFAWLGFTVSGHSLKHVVASLAAWPVCSAIRGLCNSRQNPATLESRLGAQSPVGAKARIFAVRCAVSGDKHDR